MVKKVKKKNLLIAVKKIRKGKKERLKEKGEDMKKRDGSYRRAESFETALNRS